MGEVTPDWSAVERTLWDAMMSARPKVETTKRYAKILKKARRKGGKKEEQDVKRRLGLMSEQQAALYTWKLYQRWVDH